MAGLARQRSAEDHRRAAGAQRPGDLYAGPHPAGLHRRGAHRKPDHRDQAQLQRGPGRIWQGVRANGANTLTIAGGHAIDALCAVLGEFAEVSARVSTRIPEWRALDGTPVPVDAPDSINVVGRMVGGAEVSVNVAAVPSNPGGNRMEIYGREGALVIRADGSLSIGPSEVHAGKGKEPMAPMPVPARYTGRSGRQPGRPAPQRRPGLRADGRRPTRRPVVRRGLRSRRPAPQADRRDRAVLRHGPVREARVRPAGGRTTDCPRSRGRGRGSILAWATRTCRLRPLDDDH